MKADLLFITSCLSSSVHFLNTDSVYILFSLIFRVIFFFPERQREFANLRTCVQVFTILALLVRIDGQRQDEGRGNNLPLQLLI